MCLLNNFPIDPYMQLILAPPEHCLRSTQPFLHSKRSSIPRNCGFPTTRFYFRFSLLEEDIYVSCQKNTVTTVLAPHINLSPIAATYGWFCFAMPAVRRWKMWPPVMVGDCLLARWPGLLTCFAAFAVGVGAGLTQPMKSRVGLGWVMTQPNPSPKFLTHESDPHGSKNISRKSCFIYSLFASISPFLATFVPILSFFG